MKAHKILIGTLVILFSPLSFSGNSHDGIVVETLPNSEILVKNSGTERHCILDRSPVETHFSSDGQALIISGTSYIRVADLTKCTRVSPIRPKVAAPHVGFLSDINLGAGIYASMVPVSTNPLSFVAVVAKIGSDHNMVELPGFYRAVGASKLRMEASSNILPILSRDGRYVSLDLRSCGNAEYVDVVDIQLNKKIQIAREFCLKQFSFK